jgi:hypothetical protein
MTIQIGGSINVGGAINIGSGALTGATITYPELAPPVVPGIQLQDGNATVNGSVGFTINNGAFTGLSVSNLTPANQSYFTDQGIGFFTASLGAGSTYPTITIEITQTSGPMVLFFDPGESYPATFNYPFTISGGT